jgi:hypothetical protein
MAVFWVVASRSLVEVYQRFRGPCCRARLTQRPGDGGSMDHWNAGKLLPDYTVLQPRSQPSSYSPPWEPQILLWVYVDSNVTIQAHSPVPMCRTRGRSDTLGRHFGTRWHGPCHVRWRRTGIRHTLAWTETHTHTISSPLASWCASAVVFPDLECLLSTATD